MISIPYSPTPASLYKAFEPKEAKRILDKLEFHYTPKHGSWLNMAEIEREGCGGFPSLSNHAVELSVVNRQCLNHTLMLTPEVRQSAIADKLFIGYTTVKLTQ